MNKSITSALIITIFCGATCNKTRRTAIDENERVRAVALQQAEQVVEPTPLVIETKTPEGATTSITTAPQSTTTYSLSDNTTASSDVSVREWVSWKVGVPWTISAALFMISFVLFARLTRTGNTLDRVSKYVADQLAQCNDPSQKEKLYALRNIAER